MEDDREFIERVRHQARLASRGEAERACHATLETLGEWVPESLAGSIAAQLPPGIGDQLREPGGRAAADRQFNGADFVPRVAGRAGVSVDQAAHLARAVLDSLTAATEGGVMAMVTETLPADLREYVTPGQDFI
jgi:uncharacterized protein (DUF2267 family)